MNLENINHNKKLNLRKIFLIIIAILLIILLCLYVFSFFHKSNNILNEKVNSNLNVLESLYEDYQKGLLTTDEYVKDVIYSEYDSTLLPEKYQQLKSLDLIEIDELITKYYDELSNETLRYYLQKINLNGITFELDKENEETKEISLSSFLVDTVYAKSNKVTNLNKAILSKNGNFVVWYTTTGDSATDYASAKKVADGLENTISQYKNLFGYDYNFSSTVFSKGKTYKNQAEILENSNIDTSCLESAMQVYLVNYTDSSLAKYVSGTGLFNQLKGSDDYGSILLPYILIKPSSFDDFENLEQLYNHEFFHHYQRNVLCSHLNCEMGNDSYIGEAAANWASALVTSKTINSGFLNEWAGTARKYSSNLLSPEFIKEHGETMVSYALYVYLFNYSSIVDNGTQKIINALYQNNAFEYLQNNATKEELSKVQSQVAFHNLAQDYNNKNLNVDENKDYDIQLKEIIAQEINIENTRLEKMGINYYLLDIDSNTQQFEIKIIRDNNNVSASIISESDGKYQILENSTIENQPYIFNTNNYDEYDKLYIVVYNILPTLNNYYSIEINKTDNLNDIENNTQDLSHKLWLNGFEFELGITLEQFINGTGTIINEDDLAKAKRNTNTFSSVYNEIESTIYHNDNEINFSIFVDTTDLDNITVEGIFFNSDRGWTEINPDLLAKPNLVTCGFKFLGGYDIDTSRFEDFDNSIKVKANYKQDDYSNIYEVKLNDDSGFGIKLKFNNYEKKSDVYYINYVEITNKTAAVW